ncbi:TAXI family TRAP transporter solute-binding subunit [Sporosarcina sp. FA9]|uniref:TAXI family TRAP transporter solute-binding subunit n=1 Tax=Sporosarcina sp. FA9 TaxID=3413030 RepID=UPI003F659CD0
MKKTSILILLLTICGLLLSACGDGTKVENSGSDYKTNLTLGTGSTGGVYYPFGGELANVWNDKIDVDGFDVSAVPGGGVENVAKTISGQFQLGLSENVILIDAINGTGQFEGAKASNIGLITALFPETLQVVTLESTGINSIEDLKGKKVAVGPPGGGTYNASQILMEAYGFGKGDYTPFEEGFGDAQGKLQNGTIDAIIFVVGIPSAALDELQATSKKVKFLDLNDQAIQLLEEKIQYEEYVIEAGTYSWQEEPVRTVAGMAMLFASTDQVSEDLGYEITRNLFEYSGSMAIAQAKLISKDSAFMGMKGMPLHPGAKKYYEEMGMLE